MFGAPPTCLADWFPTNLILAPIIWFLIVAWREHRRDVRAQIAANNAGAYCPHGRFTWHRAYCDGCKADAARELGKMEVNVEVKKETSTPTVNLPAGGPLGGIAGAMLGAFGGYFGGPVAGAAVAGAIAALEVDLALDGRCQLIQAGVGPQTICFCESELRRSEHVERLILKFSSPEILSHITRLRLIANGTYLLDDSGPFGAPGRTRLKIPVPDRPGLQLRLEVDLDGATPSGTVRVASSWRNL